MKEGWTYKKLGEVCEILNGFAFKSNQYVPKGIRVIRITNVQKGYVEDKDPKFYPNETLDELKKYVLNENDLLISLTGNVGRVGIIDKSLLPAYLNQRVGCIRVKNKKELMISYLYFLLNSDCFENDCIVSSRGAAQKNMSTVWLSEYKIPIPSLDDQRRIVSRLDSAFSQIDELKANAEKQLSEARKLFQAELTECMKPKEGWEEKTLGDIGTFSRGINFSKKDFVENGFPCIHYGQIHTTLGNVTYHHLTCIPQDLIKEDKLASKGDIIIAITSEDVEGSCKCTAWLGDYDIAIGAHAAIYKHSLNPVYVSYYMKSARFQREKEPYVHGFKVMEIKPSDIAKIPICYPPLSDQQAIVTRLDTLSSQVRNLEENCRKTLAECDALKQAMLREVFE